MRGNMAKGPEWAKANLADDKLQQIKRLIDLDGQLLFRCTGQRLVELPAEAEADPASARRPKRRRRARTGQRRRPRQTATKGAGSDGCSDGQARTCQSQAG